MHGLLAKKTLSLKCLSLKGPATASLRWRTQMRSSGPGSCGSAASPGAAGRPACGSGTARSCRAAGPRPRWTSTGPARSISVAWWNIRGGTCLVVARSSWCPAASPSRPSGCRGSGTTRGSHRFIQSQWTSSSSGLPSLRIPRRKSGRHCFSYMEALRARKKAVWWASPTTCFGSLASRRTWSSSFLRRDRGRCIGSCVPSRPRSCLQSTRR
mmetsp:Transcript_63367/g.185265  ORF Transcript_63367/g.185265 Transcript_63367/m.185265 type:complete len:212 (-) Transcript_63367:564-1199(-)